MSSAGLMSKNVQVLIPQFFIGKSSKFNEGEIGQLALYENIEGMKIIFQWIDGTIVFERSYQQLDGDLIYWTDKAIEEVQRFGNNIKIILFLIRNY